MSKKVLKSRTQFTSTLRNDLYDLLHETSNETGVPMSRLIDKAMEKLLEERRKEKEKH